MKCFNHPETDAVAQCDDCKKGLCKTCATKFATPMCDSCVRNIASNLQSEHKKNLTLAIVFGIGGFLFGPGIGLFGSLLVGVWFAGLPFGWRVLSKLDVALGFILVLPLAGWLILLGAKIIGSLMLGIIAAPIYIHKSNQKRQLATQLQKMAS